MSRNNDNENDAMSSYFNEQLRAAIDSVSKREDEAAIDAYRQITQRYYSSDMAVKGELTTVTMADAMVYNRDMASINIGIMHLFLKNANEILLPGIAGETDYFLSKIKQETRRVISNIENDKRKHPSLLKDIDASILSANAQQVKRFTDFLMKVRNKVESDYLFIGGMSSGITPESKMNEIIWLRRKFGLMAFSLKWHALRLREAFHVFQDYWSRSCINIYRTIESMTSTKKSLEIRRAKDFIDEMKDKYNEFEQVCLLSVEKDKDGNNPISHMMILQNLDSTLEVSESSLAYEIQSGRVSQYTDADLIPPSEEYIKEAMRSYMEKTHNKRASDSSYIDIAYSEAMFYPTSPSSHG